MHTYWNVQNQVFRMTQWVTQIASRKQRKWNESGTSGKMEGGFPQHCIVGRILLLWLDKRGIPYFRSKHQHYHVYLFTNTTTAPTFLYKLESNQPWLDQTISSTNLVTPYSCQNGDIKWLNWYSDSLKVLIFHGIPRRGPPASGCSRKCCFTSVSTLALLHLTYL